MRNKTLSAARDPVTDKLRWDADANWPSGLVADFRFFLRDTYTTVINGVSWANVGRTIGTPSGETEKGGIFSFLGNTNPTTDRTDEQRFSFNELDTVYIKRRTFIPANYQHRNTYMMLMTGDITAWQVGDTVLGVGGTRSGTIYHKSGQTIWLLFAQDGLSPTYWSGSITNTTRSSTRTSIAQGAEPANNKFFALWCDTYSGNAPTIVLEMEPDNTGKSIMSFHYVRDGVDAIGHQTPAGGTLFIGASDLGKWIDTVLKVRMATSENAFDGQVVFWVRREGESNYTKYFEKNDWQIGARASNGFKKFANGYCWGWSNSGYGATTEFHESDFMISSTAIDGVE